MTALPPAGWFPDPDAGGARWRWWDGAQWAPPGYGYQQAYDPAAHARALAMRAESTRRIGRWFRWAMIGFALTTLGIGIAFGVGLRDTVHSVNDAGAGFPSWMIAFDVVSIPFGAVAWAYMGLFIAWLYQAGKFADLQQWPAAQSRVLGAFSPLIPVVNLWWPYEAIRDNYPPGRCPPTALRWFVIQLLGGVLAIWGIAGSAFAPAAVTAVVVVITGAVLTFVPVLGWRLIADVEVMQRAHTPSPT
jgi:hypothetical protein